MLLGHLSIYLNFSNLKNRSAEVKMPPGPLLKWHVFIFNLVGGCGVFFCFVLCYQRRGMWLYVKCKLQHQERKSNI